MTTEDKNWIYIGVGLLATGGAIYWYKNKNTGEKKSSIIQLNEYDQPKTDEIETPKTASPKFNGNSGGSRNNLKELVYKKPSPPINIPMPTYMYAKGQKIMCNTRGGLKATDVQKAADGSFFTNNRPVKTFTKGEEIGEIITQMRSRGFVFYIVKGKPTAYSESDDNKMYFINHMGTKHIGGLLKPISLANVPKLDTTKILSRGSKGLEVNQLQKLLGIEIDGDFGGKTEAALFAKKKVKSISINQF